MHGPLGHAGRPRRIQPEARVVAAGRRRFAAAAGFGDQFLQGHPALRVPARYDHMPEKRERVRACVQQRREGRQQLFGYHQGLGAAVIEHELVIGGGQHRIDRDGYDARLDRAQKRARKIDGVQMHQHDSIFHRQIQTSERIGRAVNALGQLAVGDPARIVDERGLVGAPGAQIALDQVVRSVVLARNIDNEWADAIVGRG